MSRVVQYKDCNDAEETLLNLSNFKMFTTDRVVEFVYQNDLLIGINILPTFPDEEKSFIDYVYLIQRLYNNAMNWYSDKEELKLALSILPKEYTAISV
jgi:hypothetical protein